VTRVVYRNQKRNVEVCNPSNWRRTLGWWGPDVKSNTLHNWSPHEANLTFIRQFTKSGLSSLSPCFKYVVLLLCEMRGLQYSGI